MHSKRNASGNAAHLVAECETLIARQIDLIRRLAPHSLDFLAAVDVLALHRENLRFYQDNLEHARHLDDALGPAGGGTRTPLRRAGPTGGVVVTLPRK